MKAPVLEKDNCSILIAQFSTGIVYKKDLTRFSEGESEQEVFHEFSSFGEAEAFAYDLVAKYPEFECVLYDSMGEYVVTIYKDGKR